VGTTEIGLLNAIPLTPAQTTMSIRVWSPDAGIPVRLKVEDHNDPTHSVEAEVLTTTANAWETLVYDFSNEANGTAPLNFAYSFDKASIFFNFGTDGATAGEKTYYFDDLMMYDGIVEPSTYAVTFQLDMQNVTGFTTPEVNGTFNGWCGNCNAMSDVDGDGIWTVTVDMPAGNYEYKFAYDNWAGQETLLQGSSCTVTNSGFTNRSLVVSADATLPVVCWAACTSCETAPQYHSVTFQVDMQNVSGFTTPEVNGTFNGWCGNCFQMSDTDGDGIWTATTQLQEGSYEYKFSFDAWAGQEELTPGSSCTVTNSGFTNRSLQLLSDTTLNVVCWASCAACVEPTPVAVTFLLDASQVAGVTEAAISGSFNAYCADCAPMTLNSGIWSTMQMLTPGVYEYYFTLNNGTLSENLQDGVCTVNNNNVYHRIITVTEATTVDVVCYNSCSACVISVEEINSNDLVMFPNPANSELHVQGTSIADGVYTIRNAAGQLIENGKTYNNQSLTVQVSRFESGVYTISIPSAAGMTNKTFVVLR
jgi:hypothetical protein